MLMNSRLVRYPISKAVVMMAFIAAAALILVGCQRKPVMAHAKFMHLPLNGWQRHLSLTFKPQYDDSAATYDLTLAVRHDVSYAYRDLSLVVDVIGAHAAIDRKAITMPLADEYGNWTGGGFGALYQGTVTIASGIHPDEAQSVVVWQAMASCDTLHGVLDVGVVVRPR